MKWFPRRRQRRSSPQPISTCRSTKNPENALERDGERAGRGTLGNLKPLIRSKGLNGKETTTDNDDPSADPYGSGSVLLRRDAASADCQSEFRAESLLRQRNHRAADRRGKTADPRRGRWDGHRAQPGVGRGATAGEER